MPHVNTEPGQYDLTVSMYIVNVTDPTTPRTLLHRHRLLGLLMQAGGHVELNEHPWQAVAHELLEETGYKLSQVAVLQPGPRLVDDNLRIHPLPLLVNSGPFLGQPEDFHLNLTYAFITTERPAQPVAVGESDTLVWYTASELAAMDEKMFFPGVPTLLQQLLRDWQAWDAIPADDYES